MDPFSISTGVVTLLGVCAGTCKVFKKIRGLRRAPELIQALNNEVSDLHLIIACISNYLDGTTTSELGLLHVDDSNFLLCMQLLDDTRGMVLELGSFLQGRILKITSTKSESPEVNRVALLKEQGRLTRLQAQLQQARQRISSLAISLGMKGATKIEVLLRDVHYTTREIRSDMQKDMLLTRNCHTEIENALVHGFSTVSGGQTSIENKLVQGLSAIRGGQVEIENTLVRILDNQRDLEGSFSRSLKAESSPISEGIEMSLTVARFNGSASTCSCSRRRTAGYFQTCMGNLFIGYAAAPSTSRPQCFCKHEDRLVLVYCFPAWFASYILSLRAQYSGLLNMNFSFSVAQTLPHNHLLWDLIEDGEIDQMRELFQSNKVSVSAQAPHGTGTLTHSIMSGNLKSTELLLNMGADPYTEAPDRRSPYMIGWDRILTKTRTPEWREQLKLLLPAPDFEELYGFTTLHKAVLGLQGLETDSVIKAAQDINAVDKNGRTSLSWAVQRGDCRVVKHLLTHAADFNRADPQGFSPLFYAATKCCRCVSLLIKVGANINATTTKRKLTPLHYAAWNTAGGDPALNKVKPLVEAGCKINARDLYGGTPLQYAIDVGNADVAVYLANHGADLGSFDDYGHSPLTYAIMRNCHMILKLLLERGQDHTRTIQAGGTLMHLAAESSDTETLRLLQHAGLELRDIDAKNEKGLTPMEAALQRRGVDLEWRSAFGDFLRVIGRDQLSLPNDCRGRKASVYSADSGIGMDSDIEGPSDDEFEDAAEFPAE